MTNVTILVSAIDDKGKIRILTGETGHPPRGGLPLQDDDELGCSRIDIHDYVKFLLGNWLKYDPEYLYSITYLQDILGSLGNLEIIYTCRIPQYIPESRKEGQWLDAKEAVKLNKEIEEKYGRYYSRTIQPTNVVHDIV